MIFTSFDLVSFREEDTYINGNRFQLQKDEVKRIINYFKSLNKWTEYYYHEVADYYLTNYEIIGIFNLSCPFWEDKEILFDFQGFSLGSKRTLEYNDYNEELVFQSYYRANNCKSHMYWISGEALEKIRDLCFPINNMIDSSLLTKLNNRHMLFDTDNFYYKIESMKCQDLYFKNWEGIELEP